MSGACIHEDYFMNGVLSVVVWPLLRVGILSPLWSSFRGFAVLGKECFM